MAYYIYSTAASNTTLSYAPCSTEITFEVQASGIATLLQVGDKLLVWKGDPSNVLSMGLSLFDTFKGQGDKVLLKKDFEVSSAVKLLDLESDTANNILKGIMLVPIAEAEYNRLVELLFQRQIETINGKPSSSPSHSRQTIFYGAPGTGKSNAIDNETDEGNRIRTTFHPDSDYSTFVGCYKPTMKQTADGEEKIAYEFVPQAFLKAYVEAWKRWDGGDTRPYFLIIEEINRGNCAQIFGDLFQLLDRDGAGESRYAISPDEDMRKYLSRVLGGCENLPADIRGGTLMRLPANLYIWATMNTSDQSLFPIDSAFKRRWDWEYMPIEDAGRGFVIEIGGKTYDWWDFVRRTNERIDQLTGSEDKKLGYWFAKPDSGNIITSRVFVQKVLFYLWNDVFRDYGDSALSIFKIKTDRDHERAAFTDFFGAGAEQKLQAFMAYNGVEPLAGEVEKETDAADENPD